MEYDAAGAPPDGPDCLLAPAPESTAVYAYALRSGSISADDGAVAVELNLSRAAVSAAITGLVRLRLLREEPVAAGGTGRPGCRLVPVNPEVAAASLISPLDAQVHRQQAAISAIRTQLSAFRSHYDDTRGAGAAGAGVEELSDARDVATHLYAAAERCRHEVISFRPEGWLLPAPAGASLPPVSATALLDRGVRVRLLLQHAVRADIRSRAQLDRLVERGAEIRTAGELPRQLVIFDSESAFLIPDDQAASGRAGVAIRHRHAVRLLTEMVAPTWSSAQTYTVKEIGYHGVADNLHRTIVELLADGLTDEAIARRLGVSVRTCRRHIATVLRGLDAVSRFQAGVLASATGMVDRRRAGGHPGRHLHAVR